MSDKTQRDVELGSGSIDRIHLDGGTVLDDKMYSKGAMFRGELFKGATGAVEAACCSDHADVMATDSISYTVAFRPVDSGSLSFQRVDDTVSVETDGERLAVSMYTDIAEPDEFSAIMSEVAGELDLPTSESVSPHVKYDIGLQMEDEMVPLEPLVWAYAKAAEPENVQDVDGVHAIQVSGNEHPVQMMESGDVFICEGDILGGHPATLPPVDEQAEALDAAVTRLFETLADMDPEALPIDSLSESDTPVDEPPLPDHVDDDRGSGPMFQ